VFVFNIIKTQMESLRAFECVCEKQSSNDNAPL